MKGTEEEHLKELELELEEISKKVENYSARKNVPLFELFATTFSLLLSILIFQFPEVMTLEIVTTDGAFQVYGLLLEIFPVWVYGLAFFVAAMLKAVGLLASLNNLRIIGLGFSAVLYLLFSICLAVGFPSMILAVFVNLFFFTVISIPMIKTSGISTKVED